MFRWMLPYGLTGKIQHLEASEVGLRVLRES